MKILITRSYNDMSKVASKIILNEIQQNNKLILGLPTGKTPIGVYKYLTRFYKQRKISFKDITTFNLDEYLGISKDNKNSYNMYMYHNFFKNIDINFQNTYIPNGQNCTKKSINNFEKTLKKKGPIDLQILGIGENGHIGFNEPGSHKNSKTRIVKLSESTIQNNSKYFSSTNEVPKYSISMGIKTILSAKKIILLASGKNKAQAIFNTVNHKISREIPSSFLRKHKNVILIIDKDAAEILEKEDKII